MAPKCQKEFGDFIIFLWPSQNMKSKGIHGRVLKEENNSDPKVSPLFCPTKLTPYSTNFVLLRRSWKPKNSLKRVIKCPKTYSYLDIKENTKKSTFH